MKMLRTYFNEQADGWDEDVTEKDTAKLEQMAGRLELKSGSTVLDVGTGTGVFIPYLFENIGKKGRIFALDFAGEMLKKARAKRFDGNIDYLQADVGKIPLSDGTFDSVVCYSSFPHFQDKPAALAEIKRVMKDGGKLLICHTSSRARINEVHSQIPVVEDDVLPDSIGMLLLLKAAGFTEIKVEDESESYLASAMKPLSG
jgi:ubiquinone/menaquinone biosynthesis C-methylase UbiE